MTAFRDEPIARLRAALDALHPAARYVRVEAIDLRAALDAILDDPPAEPLAPKAEEMLDALLDRCADAGLLGLIPDILAIKVATLTSLDACNEAYVNASAERDMYDVAYKDMRTVVKRVIEDPSLPPNLLTRLQAVFMDGEVTP